MCAHDLKKYSHHREKKKIQKGKIMPSNIQSTNYIKYIAWMKIRFSNEMTAKGRRAAVLISLFKQNYVIIYIYFSKAVKRSHNRFFFLSFFIGFPNVSNVFSSCYFFCHCSHIYWLHQFDQNKFPGKLNSIHQFNFISMRDKTVQNWWYNKRVIQM